MRISRRLLQWSPWASSERLLRHASYYERTLYNAVLGTQRGHHPGEMLYMYPMGSGVSKAGIANAPQGHHWSDGEHHFWCCQGSGIEAFARLADSIFFRHNKAASARSSSVGEADAAQLLILQLLPSSLHWRERGVRVEIRGDYPGSVAAHAPLRVRLAFKRVEEAPSGSRMIEPWVRMPAWATNLDVKPSGAVSLTSKAKPGLLLPLQLASSGEGGLEISLTPKVQWERIKDARPQFALLQAALYGPLVLAGLTYSERALSYDASLVPVPRGEQSNLVALEGSTTAGTENGAAAVGPVQGCLVSRWSSAWVIRPDKARHFLLRPSADCLGRATPIEDMLSTFPQAHGGGQGYTLDATQTSAACARLDGCVLPEGVSAFATGRLYAMHLGANVPVMPAASPPVVTGSRRGGTDAANAATWRLTRSPVGVAGVEVAGDAVFLESFDMPGHVLSLLSDANSGKKHLALTEVRSSKDVMQLWRRTAGEHGKTRLQAADSTGMVLSMVKRKSDVGAVAQPIVPHRGAVLSREWDLGLALPGAMGAVPVEVSTPFAEYAPTAFWLVGPPNPPPTQRSRGVAGTRPFLLLPLNEMQDEHYTVYWCKPLTAAEARSPPRFCLP